MRVIIKIFKKLEITMKKYLLFTTLFMFGLQLSYADSASGDPSELLCSPQGIANLIPAFRGKDGKFEVPSSETDLPRFLQAYDSLRNVIAVMLTQAEMKANPTQVGKQKFTRFTLGKDWIASEVGFEAKGDVIPDYSKGGFGYYAGPSFLQNIQPVNGTSGTFYTIPNKGVYISPMPTILRCVNILMETSSHDSGTFISPSYALGTKDGKAFMLVNGCQNTTTTATINGQKVMTPGASSYLGIQVSAQYFKKESSTK